MNRSRLLLLALLALLACGPAWQRIDQEVPRQLPPQDQVQVYGPAGSQRWHGVRIGSDSISGIGWLDPLECDTCRTALPRSAVDSLQLGHPVAGLGKGVGLAFGTLLIYCYFSCPRGD
jgi:hypothetical protein